MAERIDWQRKYLEDIRDLARDVEELVGRLEEMRTQAQRPVCLGCVRAGECWLLNGDALLLTLAPNDFHCINKREKQS